MEYGLLKNSVSLTLESGYGCWERRKVNEVNGGEKLHEAFRGNGRVVEKVFERN